MYGAMIEAVAASGYGRTSVKQVVMLAGVSRRAFYEQFANKEECFLATLDLIANQALVHIAAGYRSTEGTLKGVWTPRCTGLPRSSPAIQRGRA